MRLLLNGSNFNSIHSGVKLNNKPKFHDLNLINLPKNQ